MKGAGGALVKYLDVAVPDFVARGGCAGSVVPDKFAALFNCAEDGVLLLELSPHRKKPKVSQPTTSDVPSCRKRKVANQPPARNGEKKEDSLN